MSDTHTTRGLCQYRTHFGGDEELIAFALPLSGDKWIPFFENPFLFYDHDHDGVTEEVLRMSGIADEVECIRHSFDADNDADWESPRDFDVSLTGWAQGAPWPWTKENRGRSELKFDDRFTETLEIRGIPTGPFLRHDAAPRFAQPVVWERLMLTWDEDDHNVDAQLHKDEEERWEGIIAQGNDDFPQVGGPSCGVFNKRYELIMKPEAPARLYYHPTDHRLHLFDADSAWMEVDYDFDRQTDMRYTMTDSDNNGEIDTWELDIDNDGTADDRWQAGKAETYSVGWNWPEINSAVTSVRRDVLMGSLRLHQRLNEVCLSNTAKFVAPIYDAIEQITASDSSQLPIEKWLHLKLINSDESVAYFTGVLNDRAIALLKKAYADKKGFWARFNSARSDGDLAAMVRIIEEEWQLKNDLRIPDYDALQEIRAGHRPEAVAWAHDWVPPNIGWESEKIAYRVYWGQFDFFGKKGDNPHLSQHRLTELPRRNGLGDRCAECSQIPRLRRRYVVCEW